MAIQYMKQLPCGNRVPSNEEEHMKSVFLDTCRYIIRTKTFVVFSDVALGVVPSRMKREPNYKYGGRGHREGGWRGG